MSEQPTRPVETPLDSWKAIADYLKRDVRTVMRWEKAEALPVHRQLHLSRSSVYAYPSELDAWRASRRPAGESPETGWFGPRARALALASLMLLALLSPGGGRVISPARSVAAQDRGVIVRQVWTGPDVDSGGTPTPDGRFLTFTDWTTGDVAVRNLATGENRRLTNKGSWATSSEYGQSSIVSPDGNEVATSWFNKDSFYDLRILPFSTAADGSPPRVLYRNEDVLYLQPFAWSPDGKQVLTLLNRKDSTNQMALVSAADGSTRVLKSLGWRYPSKMSFSPDGRYIAYDVQVRENSPDRDIVVLSADGRQEIAIVQHPAIDHAPVWTPDGRRILFASDRSGAAGLWMIQVAAGKPQGTAELLKPDMGKMRPLGFSRDGSYYYGVHMGTEDVYTVELNAQTGETLSAPTRVTERFLGSNLSGAWSPDGRRFAYFSRRGLDSATNQGPGSMAVAIRFLVTGEEREFFSNLTFDARWPVARWLPDGRSILLATKDNQGRLSLHRMDAQTGSIALVRGAQGSRGFLYQPQPPALSSDGRTVYYVRPNEETRTESVMTYDVDAGREQELFRSTTPVLSLAASRDGKRLAFIDAGERSIGVSLHVMSAQGGEPREIFRTRPQQDGNLMLDGRFGIEWTDSDRFIFFIRPRFGAEPGTELWRISPEGGESYNVLSMYGLSFPRVSPDGRRLAFTAGTQYRSEIWVMQNGWSAFETAR